MVFLTSRFFLIPGNQLKKIMQMVSYDPFKSYLQNNISENYSLKMKGLLGIAKLLLIR